MSRNTFLVVYATLLTACAGSAVEERLRSTAAPARLTPPVAEVAELVGRLDLERYKATS